MHDLIISVSGLRGVIGESLTPDVACRYVAAFAASLPPGRVLITRDGRSSGAMIGDAVRAAISAAGRTPVDAGVASTPTAGVLVVHHGCVGGVQVSASHNPAEYNGLKLFGPDGRVLPAALGAEVKRRYEAGEAVWARHDALGVAEDLADTSSEHLRRVLSIVDVPRVRARGFAVLLDANHGSGAVLARPLLEALGCRVTVLGEAPDGLFDHPPEPTEENLAGVAARAAAGGFDAVFCQDPDADRLAMIDHRGRYLGEELTLAVCVEHRLRKGVGAIVSNCSSSRVTQDLAERRGAPFHRSAVGEANVVDAMQRHHAVLGGEGAGGVIHPAVGWVRDSFVGMAMTLDAMAARDATLAELADELPRYAIHKAKATLAPERLAETLARIEAHFADATASRLDGLRLDWEDSRRWLLVRASNTEPIVRLIAEAPEPGAAAELCDRAIGLIG